MDGLELVSIVVLFLVGYWVISAIWPKKWTRDEEQPKDPKDPG